MKRAVIIAAVVGFAFTVGSVRSEEAAPDAQTTYLSKCALCHGKEGKGDTKLGQKVGAKSFTDANYQASFTDDKAFKDLKEGLKDGDTIKMKAYGDTLSDAQLKALVGYVRSFAKKAESKAEETK